MLFLRGSYKEPSLLPYLGISRHAPSSVKVVLARYIKTRDNACSCRVAVDTEPMDIVLLFALIFLNGAFAMSEMALVASRKARLMRLAEEGDQGALAAIRLGEQPTRFMSTIQIGITSIGILNGIVGEAALAGPITPLLLAAGLSVKTSALVATGFAVVFITFFSIVLGELVPKRIGQSHPEAIARLVARPINLLAQVTKPFVVALTSSTTLLMKLLGVKDAKQDVVTEEEMHAMLKETADSGVIEMHEHAMVRNVFRLDDRQLGSLMVPRSNIVTLDVNNTFEENMHIVQSSDRARFPVVRGGLDDLVGVINARKWLANAMSGGERELDKQTLRQPLFVPETITGMELLKNFKESGVAVAFVIDEYSEVQGIITMQDLIEAITGEFTPRDPDNAWARKLDDGGWLLDGHIPVPELKDVLELKDVPEEERGHYNTLSGMFMFVAGKLPQEADHIDWDGWRFTIVDMDNRIIDKVQAKLIESVVVKDAVTVESP